MLPRVKLALIHVAVAQLGLSDDDYRNALREVANVGSSKELDESGFSALMNRFEELGFRNNKKQDNFGPRAGMATPKQIDYIRDLWRLYTGDFNESSLNHWLENSFGITALRFADSDAANKALAALKQMSSRPCSEQNSNI